MQTLTMQVRGMTCEGCASRVGGVLRRVDGVRDVSADHRSGRVEVLLASPAPGTALLRERVERAGFEVVESPAP